MASYHHLRHHPAAVSYCCCCPPYSSCHHHPPPPPPPHCHQFYHQPPKPYLFSTQTHLPDSHQYRTRFRERYFEEERETQDTIASLLRRIAALESALRCRSASSLFSLRDAAARTIQAHFRAFLFRRSRTLRQLKDLAFIKSALGVLKSSVTKKNLFDYDSIYHQAMDLALKLVTVQGGDPMIRDGKKLVKRELNKFMDFMDGLYVERASSSTGVNMRLERVDSRIRVPNGERKTSNVESGGVKSVTREKLRGLVERIDKIADELDEDEESKVLESHDIFLKKHSVSGSKNTNLSEQLYGVRPKVKKSVSFADEGKVYSVLRRNYKPILDEDDDDDDYVSREVEENGASSKEADDEEDEVAAPSENDSEKGPESYLINEGNFETRMYDQGDEDSFTFSAPMPLKIETRANSIDKRKKLPRDL